MVLCLSDEIVMTERANSQVKSRVLTEIGNGNICFHMQKYLFSVKTTRTHNLSSGLISFRTSRCPSCWPFLSYFWRTTRLGSFCTPSDDVNEIEMG